MSKPLQDPIVFPALGENQRNSYAKTNTTNLSRPHNFDVCESNTTLQGESFPSSSVIIGGNPKNAMVSSTKYFEALKFHSEPRKKPSNITFSLSESSNVGVKNETSVMRQSMMGVMKSQTKQIPSDRRNLTDHSPPLSSELVQKTPELFDDKEPHFRTLSAKVRGSYANYNPNLSVDSLQGYEDKHTTTRISNMSIFRRGSQDDFVLGIGRHLRVDVLTERPGTQTILSTSKKRVGWKDKFPFTKDSSLKDLHLERSLIEGSENLDDELRFPRPSTQASKRKLFLSIDKDNKTSKKESDFCYNPKSRTQISTLDCRLSLTDDSMEDKSMSLDDETKISGNNSPSRRRSSLAESLQVGKEKIIWLFHLFPTVQPENYLSLRNTIAFVNMLIAGIALGMVTYFGFVFRSGYIEGMSMLVARLVLVKSLVSFNETLFTLEHYNADILRNIKSGYFDEFPTNFAVGNPCRYLMDTVTESVVFYSFLDKYSASIQTNSAACTANRVGQSTFLFVADYFSENISTTWVCNFENDLLSLPTCSQPKKKPTEFLTNFSFKRNSWKSAIDRSLESNNSRQYFSMDTKSIPPRISLEYDMPIINTSIITSYLLDSIPYPKRRDDLTFKALFLDSNGQILAHRNVTDNVDTSVTQYVANLHQREYLEAFMILNAYSKQSDHAPDAKVWSDSAAYFGRKYFVAEGIPVIVIVQVDYSDVQREVLGNMLQLSSLTLLNHFELVSPLFSGCTMVVATVLSFVVTRRIGRPITEVAEKLRKIADLNFEESDTAMNVSRWSYFFKRSRNKVRGEDSGGSLAGERKLSPFHEMQRIDAAIEALKSGLLSFSKYVPLDVVSLLVKMKREAVLGVDEMELTIFFSDIANFTSISEIMEPKDLVIMMSEYLDEMSNIINETQGIVDKFIGDAIMAFWNAPLFLPDHASIACKAALKSQRRLFDLRQDWKRRGYAEIFSRIGVNTGKALVGNIGSPTRLSYTCLGDTVNAASRLEGLNKRYGTSILISEATYNYAKTSYLCRPLDVVSVKGKKVPIKIFELVGARKETENSRRLSVKVDLYQECFEGYCQKDFAYALQMLEKYHKRYGVDVASRMLKEKMESFLKNGIPENWTNVTIMDEK
ncbi:hypothetical protein HK098_005267 [Nowakowskiella sp. JEL0407]|nr:hypothetical protein HK098_005267 [Nowakowskiella sp. JEL0407]